MGTDQGAILNLPRNIFHVTWIFNFIIYKQHFKWNINSKTNNRKLTNFHRIFEIGINSQLKAVFTRRDDEIKI